ncbi:MAG TPA: hypothetical protein VMU95_06460 [Trebonia sp.]|nr:hypothetical protein [Trebonia sp.]
MRLVPSPPATAQHCTRALAARGSSPHAGLPGEACPRLLARRGDQHHHHHHH